MDSRAPPTHSSRRAAAGRASTASVRARLAVHMMAMSTGDRWPTTTKASERRVGSGGSLAVYVGTLS